MVLTDQREACSWVRRERMEVEGGQVLSPMI